MGQSSTIFRINYWYLALPISIVFSCTVTPVPIPLNQDSGSFTGFTDSAPTSAAEKNNDVDTSNAPDEPPVRNDNTAPGAGSISDAGLEEGDAQISDGSSLDTQNPDKSYLLMKIKGGDDIEGERMPLHSPALKSAEIQSIEMWVKSPEGTVVGGGEASSQNRVHAPAFWGTSVVNLPTPRAVGKGKVIFRVSHRFFPAVKDG